MTVEQIIQDSIKEAKLQKEKSRRMEVRKLLDYYTGTETDKYISITLPMTDPTNADYQEIHYRIAFLILEICFGTLRLLCING